MSKPRTHWFRFSLRALLVFSVLESLLLAWWRLPFTITRTSASGGYRHTTVRRDWNGDLYCFGPTTIYYANGQKRLEYTNFALYKPHCVNDLLMPDLRAWASDGREITITQLFQGLGKSNLMPYRDELSPLYGKRDTAVKE